MVIGGGSEQFDDDIIGDLGAEQRRLQLR